MNSSQLRTFAAFADDPNLSRTARRLHLSQPAVHAQLRGLAEDLGVVLYRREGRGLALTTEGIAVAAFAREQAATLAEFRARLGGMPDDAPVVIAAGAGAIVHLLAPKFRARRRLEVLTADAGQAVDLVRSGRAHIGVGVFASPPSDLAATRLVEAVQVLVLPRAHPLAKKRRIRLADLANVPLVAPPENGPQRAALDAAFAKARVVPHVSAIARGWDVVLRLTEVGIGLGIVNATCHVPRSLRARPIPELPRVTYWAFTRPRPRAVVSDVLRALVA